MEKYKEIYETWCRMDSWGSMVDKEGLYERDLPDEMIKAREKQYFDKVERRIRFCERLLEKYQESMLYCNSSASKKISRESIPGSPSRGGSVFDNPTRQEPTK